MGKTFRRLTESAVCVLLLRPYIGGESMPAVPDSGDAALFYSAFICAVPSIPGSLHTNSHNSATHARGNVPGRMRRFVWVCGEGAEAPSPVCACWQRQAAGRMVTV